MRLLCLSDIHGEAAGLRAILPDAARGADVVVLAGDLTHLGGYAEAEALLAPLFDIGIPLLAVAGNMEHEGVRRYIGEKKVDIHGRGVVMNGVGFMGLGAGTPSPFNSPWELSDAGGAAPSCRGICRRLRGRRTRCWSPIRRPAGPGLTAPSWGSTSGPRPSGISLMEARWTCASAATSTRPPGKTGSEERSA